MKKHIWGDVVSVASELHVSLRNAKGASFDSAEKSYMASWWGAKWPLVKKTSQLVS